MRTNPRLDARYGWSLPFLPTLQVAALVLAVMGNLIGKSLQGSRKLSQG